MNIAKLLYTISFDILKIEYIGWCIEHSFNMSPDNTTEYQDNFEFWLFNIKNKMN
jgi:hypothetical protein